VQSGLAENAARLHMSVGIPSRCMESGEMSLLLNILWIVFGGLPTTAADGYLIGENSRFL
jgi:hypothetical protein